MLRARLGDAVDVGTRRRAEYSADASNYRVVPQAVVFPRTVDDILAVAEVCRSSGVPVTMRGGGTSIAGNAVGPGIVVDTSRHLGKVRSLDPDKQTAVVDPGLILDTLQSAAREHGLRFGPDPSTHARCTLGGMIGNNACGAHAVAYGRTADNVVELDVVDGTGRRYTVGSKAGTVESIPGLQQLVRDGLATIRTEFGRFGRQVSGYSLEHLLPENGGDVAKALVGTEGTCVLVLGATVRLVTQAPATALVVLGYPDMPRAADAVPALLAHAPLAIEGIDARLVDVIRRHKSRVPDLPEGGGWLLIETGGATQAEALDAGRRLAADGDTGHFALLPAGKQAQQLWRIREDGAGLAGRTAAGRQAWPGWEDAAVPPKHLGAYLRDFEALMRDHGVDGLAYGHFGDGCVHVRLDLPLEDQPAKLRPFLTAAAGLVARYGGSLSGEHGDGRARSELLPLMYSPEAIALFGRFKGLFDPDDTLNPGVIVAPRRVDADLRRPAARPLPLKPARPGGLALAEDTGDLTKALHRCVGVGKCRADLTSSGGFMCPSYLATRDERDSTRGRARVLQEMANGSLITNGFRSPEVLDVLDLCLSCKACGTECPAGVDMATYKSEVLHQAYRRRLRPRAHYSLGWLPRWARLAGRAPRLVNALLKPRPVQRMVLRAGGLDPRRQVPAFAAKPFRRRARASAPEPRDDLPQVVLWADTFSDSFSPAVAKAAHDVLTAAGYRVQVPSRPVCCGLTWISTGQLDGARKRMRNLLEALTPFVEAGIPIVGLEPSCTAAVRQDILELLPEDPRARDLAAATCTLAELLSRPRPDGTRWDPPSLNGVRIVAQPHCHHHAVMGYGTDTELLRAAGADVTVLAGCCGLAGNFGMERGHYDVSVAVAGNALLPALSAAPDALLLADGFSCRTQAAHLAGRPSVHLAELLAQFATKPRKGPLS
jgi:FAD/FMN-containing dehydrogenase/Fe-S oxidoreductase